MVVINLGYSIRSEAAGRMVHFLSGFRVAAWKQINTQTNKNSCRHIFRKTLSISSAYIIQSFILHRWSTPPIPSPPHIPLSSLCLLPLLPNLLLLLACKYMCIRYSFFFTGLRVSMVIYVRTHAHKAVCHLLSSQTKFLPLFMSWVTKQHCMPVHVPALSDLELN